MAILDPADYDAVRAALDVDLTADGLPDATIEQDVFLGRAEREIERRLGVTYLSLSAADKVFARAATVLWAASLIAISLPILIQEAIEGVDARMNRLGPKELSEALRAEALTELAQVSVTVSASSTPFFFARVPGTRGR